VEAVSTVKWPMAAELEGRGGEGQGRTEIKPLSRLELRHQRGAGSEGVISLRWPVSFLKAG